MREKEPRQVSVEVSNRRPTLDYGRFYEVFSGLDTQAVLGMLGPVAVTTEGRKRLGRFLIKGLCDLYQGDYNPHYVTGLGAALWVIGQCADEPSLVSSALRQYLSFLFRDMGASG